MPSFLGEFANALSRSGVDLGALGLAWARSMPTVTLVPAFGLRALPRPAQALLGLAFAASIFPAVTPIRASGSAPWLLLAAGEAARGVPVAIATAVPLWAATMAGGLAGTIRRPQDALTVPTVQGRAPPLGAPLSLFARRIFPSTGGGA